MLHIHEELQINHTFSFDEDLDFLRDEIIYEIETSERVTPNSPLDDKLKENENNNKSTKQSKTFTLKLNKRTPLKQLKTKIFART